MTSTSHEVAKDQRWECLDPLYYDLSETAQFAVAITVELEMPLLPHDEMDCMGG